MFHRIIDLLYEFRNYVALAVLCVVSLGLLALNDNPQVKFLRAVTSVVFGVVQEQVEFIPAYVGLYGENTTLRRLNVEYADEAYRLREARLENIRLRGLLRLKEETPRRYLAASVVGKNLTMLRNTLTINVGTADSVRERMPVVNESGLVGLVVATTASHSIVNILLNTDFRASVKIQRSRVDGILAWDGALLLIRNIPKTRDVKPGDVVITSEYSNTFPADIRVGLVTDVRDQPSSLFKTVIVTPSVDFVKLEEVFLVDHQAAVERAPLEERFSTGGR
jgi:rod shape-determining protein MreC